MEIVNVLVTDEADAMSVDEDIAVISRNLNINKYNQSDLSVIIEQITNPDIPLRDVNLMHVNS